MVTPCPTAKLALNRIKSYSLQNQDKTQTHESTVHVPSSKPSGLLCGLDKFQASLKVITLPSVLVLVLQGF